MIIDKTILLVYLVTTSISIIPCVFYIIASIKNGYWVEENFIQHGAIMVFTASQVLIVSVLLFKLFDYLIA